MIAIGIIAFRESLEILLVIVPILLYLSKINRYDLKKVIYYGIVSGIISGIACNFAVFSQNKSIDMIFQGTVMLISSGLVLTNIILLRKQSKELYLDIDKKLDIITVFNLFMLVLLIIFKESSKIYIFISSFINSSTDSTYIGILLGMFTTSIIIFLLWKISMKFRTSVILDMLTAVLILMGSSLFGEGLFKLFSYMGESIRPSGQLLYVVTITYIFIKYMLNNCIKNY